MIKNHPFLDGNKRTGAQVTHIFLRENGYTFDYNTDEIVQFVLDIAMSKVNFEYIKNWIAQRISKT